MKIIYPIAILTLAIAACNNEPPKEKTIIRTETIEKPAPQTPQPAPAPAPAPVQEPGTSVSIGPGGVSVKSKKVNVRVGGDTTNVQIRKP